MDNTLISISLGSLSLLVSALVGTWLKFAISRIFRDMDVKINGLQESFSSKAEQTEFVKFEGMMQAIENRIFGQLEKLQSFCDELDQSNRCHDKDIVRLQELSKSITKLTEEFSTMESLRSEFLEKFTRESTFLREIQSINSQIESIYGKIDRIDDKLTHK